jgi:hypothetical protein
LIKTPDKPKQRTKPICSGLIHAVTYVAMTNLRQLSSFPDKPNRKTPKTANPTLKIDSNASKIDSKASKIDFNASKLILNSKLKPRGEG